MIRLINGRYDRKRIDNSAGILRAGDLVIVRDTEGKEAFYHVMTGGGACAVFAPLDTTDGLTYQEGELI